MECERVHYHNNQTRRTADPSELTPRNQGTIKSNFSTYKRQLDYDRLRTRDKTGLRLNWIAYSLFQANTALVAHHVRTGKDMTRWYGHHFPNARAGPIEKAA